jgi:hypothetical protein
MPHAQDQAVVRQETAGYLGRAGAPPFIKVNPMAAVPTDTIQPGDITMGMMAREFLDTPDED